MRQGRKRLLASVATLALAGGLSTGLATPAGAQAEGDATGLEAALSALGINVAVPPIPFVSAPPSGSDSIVNANLNPVATALILGVQSTVNDPFNVNSSAAVVGASVLNGVLGLPSPVLGADVLTSECSGDENGTTGDADVANLAALGGAITVPVSVPPNTTIPLPLIGSLTLNEQNQTASGITVRSLHLAVNALGIATADVILAESACFPEGRSATAAAAIGGNPNLTG
jgi:hypothetical protein